MQHRVRHQYVGSQEAWSILNPDPSLPDHGPAGLSGAHWMAAWMRRRLAGVLLSLACLAPGTATAAADTGRVLYLNTAFGPPISTADNSGFFDRLMQEACRRIGYRVSIDKPQAERALMLANSGINDGDGPRIANLDNVWSYPYLVRVEEKLLDIDFVAITRDPNLSIRAWNSLAGHNVAIVTGWKILERHLAYLSNLIKVKDVEHLLLLLQHGRTDVVIMDRYSGLATARLIGLKDFHVNDPPLESTPMYLYLNIRHVEIAQKLSAALQAMKRDGTYNRIHQETLSHVIGQHTGSGH